jgi:hypothetical protein
MAGLMLVAGGAWLVAVDKGVGEMTGDKKYRCMELAVADATLSLQKKFSQLNDIKRSR